MGISAPFFTFATRKNKAEIIENRARNHVVDNLNPAASRIEI